jgi:hypothetical protein
MKYLKALALIVLLNTTIMAKQIQTEIIINASPEKVWAILTDFSNYPNWNPFIRSIKGPVIVGKKIIARIEPPEANGMTFKPKVLVLKANEEFRWIGHLLIPGLFDGEHRFELVDNGNGTTTFRQSETFHGIFIPLFKKMLDVNTVNGFKQMNEKLKIMAEQK